MKAIFLGSLATVLFLTPLVYLAQSGVSEMCDPEISSRDYGWVKRYLDNYPEVRREVQQRLSDGKITHFEYGAISASVRKLQEREAAANKQRIIDELRRSDK